MKAPMWTHAVVGPGAVALLLAAGCQRGAPATPPAPRTAPAVDAAAPAPALPPVDATTLLGGERGLDHVGVAVANLETTTHTYHDLLGFNRPTEGKLPNGVRNVNYYFADSSYLETLVHWDRKKAPWLAKFTDSQQGGLFFVLSAASPEASTAFLARRDITASPAWPGSIEVLGQPAASERFYTFFLPDGQLEGDTMFFISYPRAPRAEFLRKLEDRGVRRAFYHDNTALGLRAVWIAVPDLAVATASYEKVGLRPLRAFTDDQLQARGQAMEAGAGEVWLLAPASKKSPIHAFLHDRGLPGVIGATLLAGSVPAAAALIGGRTGHKLTPYSGQLGSSIRVPPELACGIWLEFAQYLVPASQAH